MSRGVAQKLIESHLVEGTPTPGEEIGLRIDQTLTQDATGTMGMLKLEAMELDRVRTELSVQYVDHNLVQEDFRNPDDHLFLYSACRRFGVWYSRPGNGVSHPVHQERFGVPGKTLVSFGVLPLQLPGDGYDRIDGGDVLRLENVHRAVQGHGDILVRNQTRDEEIAVGHRLSPRQADVLPAGGLIEWLKARRSE